MKRTGVSPARVEEVGHQAQNTLTGNRVEHRYPDEEGAGDEPSWCRASKMSEADQVGDEEGVEPRQELLARRSG